MDEIDPSVLVDDFPYLRERFDAIQTIKRYENDMALMSNFGRKLLAAHGSSLRRVASFPQHVWDHACKIYGGDWFLDSKNLHRVLRQYPQYSFIYGR